MHGFLDRIDRSRALGRINARRRVGDFLAHFSLLLVKYPSCQNYRVTWVFSAFSLSRAYSAAKSAFVMKLFLAVEGGISTG